MTARILVVDDDPSERRQLEHVAQSLGYLTESVADGESALARLSRREAPRFSAMILDLVMPDLDGMAVLERLQRSGLSLPVIVQTPGGSADAAGSAMRLGAFDFLVKPASPERVRASLTNALRLGALEGEVVRMRRSRAAALSFDDIVANTPATERVLRLAERAANSRTPVLIEGERGVGKELLGRAIHGSNGRRDVPFTALRCERVEADELRSALFGETRSEGARGKQSEPAGTVYLSEVWALKPPAQDVLAGLLEAKEPEGPARSRRGGVRIIAAASRPMIECVASGNFREDLFYRLSVNPIRLPPLRERRGEIPQLARRILARLAAEEGRSGIAGIAPAAAKALADYDWPGNFHELEHVIFRAVMLCEGNELAPAHFPQIPAAFGGNPPVGHAAQGKNGVAYSEQQAEESPSGVGARPDTRIAARYGTAKLLDERGEMRRFESLEEEVIRFAIDHYRGRMSEVARKLGIGRSTLYRKIRDYGIVSEEPLSP